MFTKPIFLLLIASLAFAAQISLSANLEDEVDDLLVKLNSTINSSIASAQKQFISALKAMNRTNTDSKNRTSTSLSGMRDTWETSIDALKQKARNSAVNIDECLKDEKTLLNMTWAFEIEDIRCIRGHEQRILSETNNAYTRILRERAVVAEFEQQIVNCKKDVDCLEKIAKRIETDLISLPVQIETEVKKTVSLIETIETTEITRCEGEILRTARTKGDALLKKITKCVDDKIGH